MPTLNKVFIIGWLTRDPELRRTGSGTAVTECSLAVHDYYRNKKSGDKEDNTSFVDIVIWKEKAETFAEYTKKGSEVLIIGRLKQDRWTTQDNHSRSKIRVVCDEFQFLSKKNEQESVEEEIDDPGAIPF
jgi:single-strand DNA-binding protein